MTRYWFDMWLRNRARRSPAKPGQARDPELPGQESASRAVRTPAAPEGRQPRNPRK